MGAAAPAGGFFLIDALCTQESMSNTRFGKRRRIWLDWRPKPRQFLSLTSYIYFFFLKMLSL